VKAPSPVTSTVIAIAAWAFTAGAAEKVTYEDQILPIFRNSCLNCHNPDKKKAGLDLSTFQGALQGSENGKVLNSGDPSGSLLLKCVLQTEDPKMPPKGDKLSDVEIGTIKKWIEGQLLESAGSKGIAASSNNVQVAVVSLKRPDGPPPMPKELPLEPVTHTTVANALTALGASPWAPLVAIGGQKQIILYNTETLEPLGVLPFPEGFPTIIKFSRNGKLILTGGGRGGKSGKVVLWDVETGERIGAVGNEFDQVLAADISADQQLVALGGPNKLVKIYSTKDGKLLHSIKKHTDWVTAIAFSPDGKLIASADRSGGLVIWESDKGKEYVTLPGHPAMITGVAFMMGVVASGSEDGAVKLWDVKEGKEIKSWSAHPGGVQSVDFTPDGRLVSCGRDKTAKVWDQTGKQLMASEPFQDIALRAEMAGERVVAGDWTGRIRVWTVDGKCVGELSSNPPSLADRLSSTAKTLTDNEKAIPSLQQQLTTAEAKWKTDQAAAEAKKSQLETALNAVKGEPQAAEKNLNDAKAQLAAAQTAGTTAKTAADAAQKAAADKQSANAPAPELDAARQEAATKAAAHANAEKQVAALKTQVAQLEVRLAQFRKEQPAHATAAEKALKEGVAQLAALQPGGAAPAAQEVVKAKAALDQATALIASSKTALEKWKIAKIFQNAHDARASLEEKQAKYEEFVQAAKDAPLAVDKARADLEEAEKAVGEAPQKLADKETLFNQAQEAVEPAKHAVAAGEATLAEKEKALAALIDAAVAANPAVVQMKKNIEAITEEQVALRTARSTKIAGTPEYAELVTKLQAKRAQLTQSQTALEGLMTKAQDTPEIKAAQAGIAQTMAALDKARRDVRTANEQASAAEKAFAQAKKQAESAIPLAAKLIRDMPEVMKNAEASRVEAEQAAAAAKKEVDAAKIEADKRRADYETLKGGVKSASLSIAPAKF
jgi:Planctomycete cytochrome C/WD domain, G-beta repeat